MSERRGGGNPPNHGRFKPGESGNPRGRPKGRKNLNTILREELSKVISVRQGNGKTVKKTKLALILEQLTNDGLRGQPRAREQILKLAMGLPDTAETQGSAGLGASDDGFAPDTETLRQIARRFAHLGDDGESS